ncbi:MAG: hypothetical protein ACYDB7_14965 [Mycobacteriales bacterium]
MARFETTLPKATELLAVCAHSDAGSFGVGGVLASFAAQSCAPRSLRLPRKCWALPEAVAARINIEFGTGFVGRAAGELDFTVAVDRARQLEALACHASQSRDNPALWRRLELLATSEHLRWLTPAPPGDRAI